MDEGLLLAHDYLGFQMEHTDYLLALVANPLAVVASILLADAALTIDLVSRNEGLANIALP